METGCPAPTVRRTSHLTAFTLRGEAEAASTELAHSNLGLGSLNVAARPPDDAATVRRPVQGPGRGIKPVMGSEPPSHLKEKHLI